MGKKDIFTSVVRVKGSDKNDEGFAKCFTLRFTVDYSYSICR